MYDRLDPCQAQVLEQQQAIGASPAASNQAIVDAALPLIADAVNPLLEAYFRYRLLQQRIPDPVTVNMFRYAMRVFG